MKTKLLLCTSAVLLSGLTPALLGCKNSAGAQMAPIVDGNTAATDPTAANFASPYPAAPYAAAAGQAKPSAVRYAAVSQSSAGSYPQQTAQYPQQQGSNGNSQQNEAYRYNTQPPQNGQYNNGQQGYADPQYANGQQGSGQYADPQSGQITDDEYDQYQDLLDPNVPVAQQPPPPLPVDYQQPEAPGPDYLWTPGYWDYANTGYYYVPGAWVGAPYAGALWTPGWWGFGSDRYRWHHGYWGQHVGYYGGVNYGFGFIGFGYQGGYWNNNHFFYNTAVNRVNARIVNNYTYERRVTVVNNTYVNNSRTSYFGGPGGLRRGPAPQEFAARREQRLPPMQAQIANRQAAQSNRQQFFNANGGRPQMLVSNRALAPDRNITAPAHLQPGNNSGNFNGRPGAVNGNETNGTLNVQQRQQFERNRQQQELQRGQERNQLLQQRDTNAQQRDTNLQQRDTNLQQRDTNLQQRNQEVQQRQQFDQQRQQQQLNNGQQRQQLDQQRQQQQLNNEQQRGQFDQQRQQFDQQRQQQLINGQQRGQFDQQRQQTDAVRQQQQRTAQDQQRIQQQRQQQDQQLGNAQRQQQDLQRQQQNIQRDQQRQQQQVMQSRPAPAPAPHVEAPRAAPSMPRAEAQHVEAPHGGGEHH